MSSKPRVIILLDLDCFYAQCEIVRLGVDPSTPVALLQWNSALAVSYPARDLGIQRGDSFEKIKQKSHGKCVAFHLPVIALNNTNPIMEGSVKECYDQTYKLPSHVQADLFQKEKDKMRSPNEGKASLERYRLASARIFEVILQYLLDTLGESNFVLERASIDELFLDVSQICLDPQKHHFLQNNKTNQKDIITTTTTTTTTTTNDETNTMEDWKKTTKLLGEPSFPDLIMSNDGNNNPLHVGCQIAFQIRKCLYETLGFTMSAGISTNKLLAKLAAGHGKPDGMAILYPDGINELMDETKIRKVRNLGGKIGKQLISILPKDVSPTMGSVRRLLSLPDLTKFLSCPKTAQMIFDACRGEDDEIVRETKLQDCCLTKSITAFKSFRPVTNIDALDHWVRLLASDVIHRVEVDSKRNKRTPKNCNIQYTYTKSSSDRIARSVRIPFPTQSSKPTIVTKTTTTTTTNDKTSSGSGLNSSSTDILIDTLVENVKNALQSKNQFPLHRLGLSATDFIDIGQNGSTIESFFSRTNNNSNNKNESKNNDKPSFSKDNCSSVESMKKNKTKQNTEAMIVTTIDKNENGTNNHNKNLPIVPNHTGMEPLPKLNRSIDNVSQLEKGNNTEIITTPKSEKDNNNNNICQVNLQTELDETGLLKDPNLHYCDTNDDICSEKIIDDRNYQTDLDYARKLQEFYNNSDTHHHSVEMIGSEETSQSEKDLNPASSVCFSPNTSENTTRDMVLAKKLQASFDRENMILCSYEDKHRNTVPTKIRKHFSSSKNLSSNGTSSKKGRIDSFFVKKR